LQREEQIQRLVPPQGNLHFASTKPLLVSFSTISAQRCGVSS
jgi:hypothetical protein